MYVSAKYLLRRMDSPFPLASFCIFYSILNGDTSFMRNYRHDREPFKKDYPSVFQERKRLKKEDTNSVYTFIKEHREELNLKVIFLALNPSKGKD